MRHDDPGHATLAGGANQAHDTLAVDGVQRPGWLVGEQEPPVADDGAGDRDPLTLTTRQLVRVVPGTVGQAQLLEGGHRHHARRPGTGAVELQRQRHVLGRRQSGQQVEVLEHVADRPAPQPGPIVARHRRDVLSVDEDVTGRGLLEGPGDRQQRALARSARTHDRDQLAGVDCEVDIPHRFDERWTLAVGLRHLPQFERSHHRLAPTRRRGLRHAGSGGASVVAGSRLIRASAASSHRITPSRRIELGVGHEQQSDVVVAGVLLQTRVVAHRLDEVPAVGLHQIDDDRRPAPAARPAP